jgi:hypothetical protein
MASHREPCRKDPKCPNVARQSPSRGILRGGRAVWLRVPSR